MPPLLVIAKIAIGMTFINTAVSAFVWPRLPLRVCF
jgi:hypothetical protein